MLDEVGLPITVGVASTKYLAKVASAVAKPDGLLLVPLGGELAFLHPLPVERLWGVGDVTSRKLRGEGLRTVGDVAAVGEQRLVEILGKGAGRHIHALAHNRDPRRVRTGVRRRSIGSQRAFGRRGPRDLPGLDALLVGLIDRIARRLRAAKRVCRTVMLRLRFDDYTRATRSQTMPESTAHTDTILATARELLVAAMPMIDAKGITLLGVSLQNLESTDAAQMLLPSDLRRAGALDAAVDDVRDRFGSEAIMRAVLLKQSRGLQVPLLPD